MTALSIASSHGLGVNQQVFVRLKQALLLGLRRQILIAVCDNLPLRQKIILRLEAEFRKRRNSQNPSGSTPENGGGNSSPLAHWVTLTLNLEEPNPIAQIEGWFAENGSANSRGSGVGFQILGVEQLTRRPAAIQWSFLHHLRNLESHLPQFEFSLLLWIPSPWLRCIEQSAPEFWRWRTAVFEFAGEPAPLAADSSAHTRSPSNITSDAVKLASNGGKKGISITPPSAEGKASKTANSGGNWKQIRETLNELRQTVAPPEKRAESYRQVIESVRQQMAGGLTSDEQIERAIAVYETGWRQLEQDTARILDPSEIVDWLNDLGTLYWMGFHRQKAAQSAIAGTSHLERSIIYYQKALMHANPDRHIQALARVQKNLGAACGDLARIRDPLENWQQSIDAYTEAIAYFQALLSQTEKLEGEGEPPKALILSYAATQNNLGTAHWNLAQHTKPGYHLKAAISAYAEAGRYYSPEQHSRELGMIQANIGIACWTLAQHEPEEQWLHLAIEAYENALKYRTPETDRAACAATQNNLGIAYWHLGSRYQDAEIRARFLQKAIASYEAALALARELNPVRIQFDPSATHNNLGLAHYQLAKDLRGEINQSDRVAHLEAALSHHLRADTGQTSPPAAANGIESGRHQIVLGHIVRTIRAIYQEAGLPAQNRALSQIPGHLLSEILRSV